MIPLVFFLLMCVAVYLGTIDAAFSVLMRLSLRLLVERGGRGESLSRYLEDPVLLFVPVRLLLGLTIVVATAILAEWMGLAGWKSVGLLVLPMAGFLLLCVHFVPLAIVRDNPERILDLMLPSFDVAARVLRPLTAALVGLIVPLRRDRAAAPAPPGEAQEEKTEATQGYLAAAEQEGLIERDERHLLQSIVDFGNALVREVMTPRPDIVAIRAEATLRELRALLREQQYSRIPVFKESLDNILGVVFVKDLIQLDVQDGEGPVVTTLMRPGHFVPETKRVPELLKEFQRHQVQIALVVDEYGGTAGLVTMEDLLEEIVGEIRDEYDEASEPIIDQGDGVFVFSGKVDIDEVVERLNVPIEREGFETVNGYLLSHLGRMPRVGEVLEIDGLSVEVLEAERRRVHKVRIRRRESVTEVSEA
jgi:putative hemolysin